MPHDQRHGFQDAGPSSREEEIWVAPPEPLPPELAEAPTLPAELIPEALRPWLCDITDRMQVPLEFVAAPAVVALSSLIGRNVGMAREKELI